MDCPASDLTCNPAGFLLRRLATGLRATTGRVKSFQKISDVTGGLSGGLEDSGFFGRGAVAIGDLDGDGVTDIAASAWADDDGGLDTGAVWILFMNRDGTVKSQQVISLLFGNFTGSIIGGDYFGYSLASLGDLDGDGHPDLAVGAVKRNDGGAFRGAAWVLLLNSDGTVKTNVKISDTTGGFTGGLQNDDQFGCALTAPGDLDGDGVRDLIVGSLHGKDGGTNRGAVWVIFLNSNGTVKAQQKISNTAGGFGGALANDDNFGSEAAILGDLDGDGVADLVVGAGGTDDGGTDRGAVWILFMNTNGTVKSSQKISNTTGGFTGTLADSDFFGGVGLVGPGDLDLDGVPDLVVGATGDDDGGTDRGAVWVLFLNRDGTVKSHQKISDVQGNFTGGLVNSDVFGGGIGSLGDLDGDRVPDLVVGAPGDGITDRGAAWVLFLDAAP